MTFLDDILAKLDGLFGSKQAATTTPQPIDTTQPTAPIDTIQPIAPIETTPTQPIATTDSISPVAPSQSDPIVTATPIVTPTPTPIDTIQPIQPISPVTPSQSDQTTTTPTTPTDTTSPINPPATYQGGALILVQDGAASPSIYANPTMTRIAGDNFKGTVGGATEPPETGTAFWYSDYPLYVNAVPYSGYIFDHWEFTKDSTGAIYTSTDNPIQAPQWCWILKPVFRKL